MHISVPKVKVILGWDFTSCHHHSYLVCRFNILLDCLRLFVNNAFLCIANWRQLTPLITFHHSTTLTATILINMPSLFACYNINCYSKFKTQKGLSLHLAHNPACQHYVAHFQRPVATNPQTIPLAAAPSGRVTLAKLQQSNWYGTHAQRLNPFMGWMFQRSQKWN